MATWTSGLHPQDASGLDDLAMAIAAATGFARRPGPTSGAAAAAANFAAFKLHFARHTASCFEQRQRDFALDVGAACRA
jgi:hypothetical protein